MKKISIIIVLVLVLLGIGFISWEKLIPHKPAHPYTKMNMVLAKEVTVTLDKNGFSPATVTIKKGTAVRWKNASGKEQTVNSDNYPTNQLHKELNFGAFNNGSTVMYTFTKPGTYGYHNQFHPEQKGTIIVTQ
ncbi:MAG TPA: cupredoxin domain-containing protein [Methylomirabilota bacterium]|nr:cupredoxin domain-containing protein [Methylomirabilota bacterium]